MEYKKKIAKEILLNLPENIIRDINKLKEEIKRCTICLEDFKINDLVIYLPCFHFFHKKCITKWILNKTNCPLCKINIQNLIK